MPSAVTYVYQQLAAELTDCEVLFGFRTPRTHSTKPRVCCIPGDDGMNVGELTLPKVKTASGVARSTVLYTTRMLMRLVLDASNLRGSVDQTGQYEELMTLRSAVLRVLKRKLGSLWTLESETYADKLEDTRTSHMSCEITISVPDDVLDEEPQFKSVQADGELTVHVPGQTATTHVP